MGTSAIEAAARAIITRWQSDPVDVDIAAWEAMRGGYQATDPVITQDQRKRDLAARIRYRVMLLRMETEAERARWRPFFRQFDRSDARTWWRWRKRDRVARLRARMYLDD